MIYSKKETIKKSKTGEVDDHSLRPHSETQRRDMFHPIKSGADDGIKTLSNTTSKKNRSSTPSLVTPSLVTPSLVRAQSETFSPVRPQSKTLSPVRLQSKDGIMKTPPIKSQEESKGKSPIKSQEESKGKISPIKSQEESKGKIKKNKDEDSSQKKQDIKQQTSSGQQNIDLDSGVPIINLANNINRIGNILPKFEPLPVLVGLVGLGILLTM